MSVAIKIIKLSTARQAPPGGRTQYHLPQIKPEPKKVSGPHHQFTGHHKEWGTRSSSHRRVIRKHTHYQPGKFYRQTTQFLQ
jgi:hypothetical protein